MTCRNCDGEIKSGKCEFCGQHDPIECTSCGVEFMNPLPASVMIDLGIEKVFCTKMCEVRFFREQEVDARESRNSARFG